MAPGEPQHPVRVWRQARRTEEIVSVCQHAARRRAGMVEIDRHDGVDRFAFARMVLTHANPALPPLVEYAVAIAPPPSLPSPACGGGKGGGGLRRQRLRNGLATTLAVQALIGKIGKDADAVRHQPRRAAIFMYARAGIKAGWRDVRGGTV